MGQRSKIKRNVLSWSSTPNSIWFWHQVLEWSSALLLNKNENLHTVGRGLYRVGSTGLDITQTHTDTVGMVRPRTVTWLCWLIELGPSRSREKNRVEGAKASQRGVLAECMGYLWGQRGRQKGREEWGGCPFSCHFTAVSFPSEPSEQESGATGKVSPRPERLVDGGVLAEVLPAFVLFDRIH